MRENFFHLMPVVQYCSYCSYCTTKFYSFSLDTGSYCIVMVMKRRGTDIAGQTLNRAMCAQNEKDFAKWIKGRINPNKKEQQIDDMVNIFLDWIATVQCLSF